MSQLQPKKTPLKLKFKNPTKKTEQLKYNKVEEQQQSLQKNEQGYYIGKTLAERTHDLVKRTRMIQKINEKIKYTNKQKIETFNKALTRLPDHQDIPKIGQKIQKGY